MSTVLDAIFKNDSQLFKVSVYDTDGITPLTPLSCVCSVWEADTDTASVTAQAGTVGAGFAQYNWAGTSTAGHYEATLTVTISAGVVKTEHFRVDVLAKPPEIETSPSEFVGRLRRMTNEKNSTTYSDADLTTMIERYPLLDEYGYDYEDTQWTPTYDLNKAAADVWEEKAGAVAGNFDFQADGGNYSRSQAYEQMMKQARYYRSRRSHNSVSLQPVPEILDEDDLYGLLQF